MVTARVKTASVHWTLILLHGQDAFKCSPIWAPGVHLCLSRTLLRWDFSAGNHIPSWSFQFSSCPSSPGVGYMDTTSFAPVLSSLWVHFTGAKSWQLGWEWDDPWAGTSGSGKRESSHLRFRGAFHRRSWSCAVPSSCRWLSKAV